MTGPNDTTASQGPLQAIRSVEREAAAQVEAARQAARDLLAAADHDRTQQLSEARRRGERAGHASHQANLEAARAKATELQATSSARAEALRRRLEPATPRLVDAVLRRVLAGDGEA